LFVDGALHFLEGFFIEFGLGLKGDMVAVEDNGRFFGWDDFFVNSDFFGSDVLLFGRKGTGVVFPGFESEVGLKSWRLGHDAFCPLQFY
jgi:hypothetical protein